MKPYTVFCQPIGNPSALSSMQPPPSIHHRVVSAASVGEAREIGQSDCAAALNRDPEEIHVLCVAAGEVEILFWEDGHDA